MTELTVTVTENLKIAEGTFVMTFETERAVNDIRAGMFVMLKPANGEMLLKRPFGILKSVGNSVSIAYQVKGGGTESLMESKAGDRLSCLMPLGNGFEVGDANKIVLVGGGAGVFPLLSVLDKYPDREISSYLGFRNKAAVCLECEFSKNGRAVIATDDGSYGIKGSVVDAFINGDLVKSADLILACGPKPMLSALKKALAQRQIKTKTLVSLEERMGCGVGACLVCTCDKTDGGKARVCKDGPVFDIWEVEL